METANIVQVESLTVILIIHPYTFDIIEEWPNLTLFARVEYEISLFSLHVCRVKIHNTYIWFISITDLKDGGQRVRTPQTTVHLFHNINNI